MPSHGAVTSTDTAVNTKAEVSFTTSDAAQLEAAARFAFEQDAIDMQRLGRQQELRRNFTPYTILGFASVVQLTWPAMLTGCTFTLLNGGMAGMIYMYIAVWFSFFTVAASLGEMASMAPTSSGQYHWVSEFAPASSQRFLSYVTGWLTALGWQAVFAGTCYIVAGLLLELVSFNHPTYTPQNWHISLTMIATGIFCTVFNIWLAKRLPMIEGVILFLFVFGLFATIIPLLVLAPKLPAHEVFTGFANYGGWSTNGAATVIGGITAIGSFFGTDGSAHLSEEIRNASIVVPYTMLSQIALNGALGLVVIVIFAFCITDIDVQIGQSTAVFPFIEIFYNAVGSKVGATALVCITWILTLAAGVSSLAAASRQAWAFARDNGFPFAPFFRQVTTVGTPIPLNAIVGSMALTIVLALINIGSAAAFNSIIGLINGATGFSFSISISCVLLKRLRGEPMPPSRFWMGKFGIPVNVFAILFGIFQVVISYFPAHLDVTVATMNWGSVMFAGVSVLSIGYFFVHGRKVYKGPVVHVRRL